MIYQLTAFVTEVGTACFYLIAKLAEMKRMYEGKVFEVDKFKQEVDKLKQKLEESETAVVKVCSLLVVMFKNVIISWANGCKFC